MTKPKTTSRTARGYAERKGSLLKRLSRAEGQIRGISRMVAEDTYCIDVLTQLNAAQAALDKVALELLRDHARNCLNPDADYAAARSLGGMEADKRIDELVSAVGRTLGR